MNVAPDFVEPIVGYRRWQVDSQLRLWPSFVDGPPWMAGPNQAVCAKQYHPAPHNDCRCGLYARHDCELERLEEEDSCFGAIAAWGDVEVYERGFRAEYAQVVALGRPKRPAPGWRLRLHALATAYGVPLVPGEQLEQEALRWGHPVPQTHRPQLDPLEEAIFEAGCSAAFVMAVARRQYVPEARLIWSGLAGDDASSAGLWPAEARSFLLSILNSNLEADFAVLLREVEEGVCVSVEAKRGRPLPAVLTERGIRDRTTGELKVPGTIAEVEARMLKQARALTAEAKR